MPDGLPPNCRLAQTPGGSSFCPCTCSLPLTTLTEFQSPLTEMKHIVIAVAMDAFVWESCRPFVEKLLAQVVDFYAEVDAGLWVFRTQECYSVVHELEHFFACH